MKKSIAEFETTLDKRATAKGAKVAATAAIESSLERGLNAVRKLDAIVKNKFRGDAAKLAAWGDCQPYRAYATPRCAAGQQSTATTAPAAVIERG